MFGKEADTMRMLRYEDQNRGFDENWPFCDAFFTAVHFIQVVVQKHTKIVSSINSVNMFDKSADTMQMFRAKRRTGRILTSSDMRQKRSFGQPPIAPAVGGI